MLTKDGKPWGEYECELVINGGKTAAWCRLGGFLRELVSLDTGSPICVLSEGSAKQLLERDELTPINERHEGTISAYGRLSGWTYFVSLVFLNDDVPMAGPEVVAVVLDDYSGWGSKATLIGYRDGLERLRFAFEPALVPEDPDLFLFGLPGAAGSE